MSEPLQPDPDRPQLPLPDLQPEVDDLEPVKQFVKHDTWRNVIAVSKTKLLAVFVRATIVMEELHRKQLLELFNRMERLHVDKVSVSRTTHNQIASILKRYLEAIKAHSEELHDQVVAAIEEARKIEKLCEQIMEDSQRQRTKGNVRFVKQLIGKR